MTCFLERLRYWSFHRPEKKAFFSPGKQVTYRELEEYSNQIANLLCRQGVASDSVVALCVGDGVDFAVCLMGVLKSGAGCALLSGQYPPLLRQRVLEKTGARFWLGDIPAPDFCTCKSVEIPKVYQAEPQVDAPVPVNGYPFLICTSGTTGEPKVNAIPLKIWNTSIRRHVEFYESIGKDGDNGIFAAPEFAFGLTTMLLSMVRGQSAYIADEASRGNLFSNLFAIEKYGLTNALWSAAVVNILSLSPILMEKIPHCLETIGCSGTQLYLSKDFCQFCLSRGISIQNGYGTTETLGIMMNHVDMAYYMQHNEPVSVGNPFPGIRASIHPENGGDSDEGELVLYFEDETYQGLFPDNKLVMSDLARKTPDGYRLLGRIDNVVKIKGYRVNLESVESCLMCSGLAVELYVLPNEAATELVCIYTADRQVEKQEWEQILRRKLPAYMWPVRYVLVEQFPRLQTGKVDRKRIKQWVKQNEMEPT